MNDNRPGSHRASLPRLDRRTFIEAAVVTGLAPSLAAGSQVPAPPPTAPGPLPTRPFGKTGRTLPILSYGGAALPRVWLNPLSREDRVALVRYAFERGLRYFDTAGNYMESQAILGEALKDVRREIFLVSKVETTDPREVRAAVEKSLDELQTDHLDAILIHGTPGIEQMTVPQAMKIHAELVKLRDEKIVRHLGLSAHGYFDKALALIDSGGFELCMLAYGYVSRGYDQIHSSRSMALRDACLARSHELGMGIAAMKVVAAGWLGAWASYVVADFPPDRLRDLPAAAIRHVLSDDRVDTLVIGMRLKPEIDANLRIVSQDRTYTAADRALLAAFSARLHDSETLKKLRIE